MNRELQQQNSDEEVLAELDRFVIEAIDTLIATSRQVKSVRQRQQNERQRHANETTVNKVTKLKPRFSNEDDEMRHAMQEDMFFQDTTAESDEDDHQHADDLAGMTPHQREQAEAFAGWLVQQDNYPIILQHVEELLAVMEDDFSWENSNGDNSHEINVQEQSTDSDSEEKENADKPGSGK